VNSSDVLGGIAPEQVRVRFPPSPTGNLHVGNVRSALFNWVFARHYGGTFVLRIEDTDAARNLEAAYDVVYDSLKWLGLTWDEGPGVGGPYGPYLQTQRLDTYAGIVPQLLDGGHAYRCFYPVGTEAGKRALADNLAAGVTAAGLPVGTAATTSETATTVVV